MRSRKQSTQKAFNFGASDNIQVICIRGFMAQLWRFPVDLIHSVVMRVPGLDPGIDLRIHHLCFPLPTLPRRSVLAESIVRHKHSRCCFRGLGWMRTVITPLIFALTSPPTEGAISRGLQHDIFGARVLSAFFAAF